MLWQLLAFLCPPLFYYRLSCFLLLSCLVVPCAGSEEGMGLCSVPKSDISGLYREGDIIIGGVFPVHVYRVYQALTYQNPPPDVKCNTFVALTFQWMQSLLLAVSEISNSTSLLPNLTLGVHLSDSCASPGWALEGGAWFLTGGAKNPIPNFRCNPPSSPLGGVIGDSSSASSLALARLLGLYRYPQISYFSTSSLLSDRIQFPSFFRTVPSDSFQSQGLAKLVLYFGWTWVGLLAEDTDYGLEGIRATKIEIQRSGACVAFTGYILTSRPDRNAPYLSKIIAESTARVIVVFSSGSNLLPVVEELLKHNITGRTWVASESWSTSVLVSKEKYWSILQGTIGFALHSGQIPGFKEFLNSADPNKTPDDIFLKEFWEVNLGCKWEKPGTIYPNNTRFCTGQESVGSMFSDISVPRVLNSMKVVNFKAKDGRNVYFDSSGNLPPVYDIVNWQLGTQSNIRHVKVGSYDGSAREGYKFTINTSSIQWTSNSTKSKEPIPLQMVVYPLDSVDDEEGGDLSFDKEVPNSFCSQSCPTGFRKAVIRGKPVCCFQCVPCPYGEISNQTDSIDCSRCTWDQWPSIEQDQCLPKPMEFLSYEDPLGVTLVSTSIASSTIPVALLGLFIRYKTTPIVRANNYSLSCLLLVSLSLCFLCSISLIGYPDYVTCLLRQVAFGMVFSLCVSCILAKTITVVIAFKATKPGSSLRKWTGTKVSYYVIGICVLIQLCICIIWLSLYPPFPENDIQTQPGLIIVHCNEGSPTAFWCLLGYLGLLATISFILAFLVRRLPDSFNEAKFITFSMLSFLSVWVSFIPAYLSTRGKYTVAMEVFAILSSSWALVVCIFVPKCFIILFRPELNTKNSLMGRGGK
ncbi:extracellular calcium-sensing receptor-like [Rhinophrynus dorsalis]